MITVVDYTDEHAAGWLRCRLLSFFDTDYFDDVATTPTTFPGAALRLLAVDRDRHGPDQVRALLDVEIDGDLATIDSVAVHPDDRRHGLATTLLDQAVARLQGVGALDAWTRESVAANHWYRARSFVERFRYLHVYKGYDESTDGFVVPAGLRGPMTAFLHAPIESEVELRARFARVHVCRRYVRDLT